MMSHAALVLRHLDIALIAISSLVFILRLYARLVVIKNPGWDDALAFCAFCFGVAMSTMEIRQTDVGMGQPIATVLPKHLGEFYSNLSTILLLFLTGSTFTRLSVCAFLPRLNSGATFRKMVWGLAGCIFVVYLVSFCLILFQCRPVSGLWNRQAPGVKCVNINVQTVTIVVHGSFGVIFDVILLGTPIWVIYHKMIRTSTTIKVMLVFCVATFSIITNMIRLKYISTFNPNGDFTLDIVGCTIWSDLELHTGFCAASLPALPPLLRLVSYKLGLRSQAESRHTGENTNNTHRSYQRSNRRSQFIPSYIQKEMSTDGSQENIVQIDDLELNGYTVP